MLRLKGILMVNGGEWLQNPTTNLYEAPGVRNIPGMRRLSDLVFGKPYERLGAFNPKLKTGLWAGPQTFAGRDGLKMPWMQNPEKAMENIRQGKPEQPATRVENLRRHGTIEPPKQPAVSKFRQFLHQLNQQTGGKVFEGNMDLAAQDWIAGPK